MTAAFIVNAGMSVAAFILVCRGIDADRRRYAAYRNGGLA